MIVGLAASAFSAGAAEWFVDRATGDDTAAAADATGATAFKTIQAAINRASADDVIRVAPGVYDEGVDFGLNFFNQLLHGN